MSIVLIAIKIVLAGMFAFSAWLKFSRADSMTAHWREYRYPMPLMTLIALLETAGTAALLASFRFPAIAKYAAALLIVLMLGAIHAHLFRAGHKPVMALNALTMLALSAVLLLS